MRGGSQSGLHGNAIYYKPDAGSEWLCNYQDKRIIWGVQPGWALLMINLAVIRQDHVFEASKVDLGCKHCLAQAGCSLLLEVLSGVQCLQPLL